jgi:hypothetical protein
VSFLLDTNIISDLRRTAAHTAPLDRWFAEQTADSLFVSVITIGEIREGIERLRRRESRRAGILAHWLDDLSRVYRDRVLPIDAAVADEWGRLRSVRTLPVVDALLAATARTHGLTLVTRNDKDFAGLNLDVLNPFH